MSTPEAFSPSASSPQSRRVVEAEIRLPTREELRLPQIDLQPARAIAKDALLTGLGVGVLAARGLVAAVRAAHRAGAEAAGRPGSVGRTLLGWLQPESSARPDDQPRVRVPVLPIDSYDQLSTEDVLARLDGLTTEQLQLVRQYEAGHQARPEVLEALDRRLA